MSSFAADRALFGFDPVAFHAVSLCLYALVVALGTRLVERLAADRRTALVAGCLFAVHPVGVEAAAWISARCDLLAAAGGFAALLLYDAFLTGAPRRARSRAVHWGAAGCLALALFAKESAVLFLVPLLALDGVRGAAFRPGALLRRQLPFGAALLLYLALRVHALGGVSQGLVAPLSPVAVLGAMGQGVARLLWPRGLSIAPPPPTQGHVALGLLACALAAAAGLRWGRARSVLCVPLGLGVAALLVGAVGAARIGELADRYLLPVVLAAAWLAASALVAATARLRAPVAGAARLRWALVAGAARLRWAPVAVVAAALAVLAGISFGHVRVYESDERLWEHAWRHNPHSVRAALNLAKHHLDRGEIRLASGWLDRAEALRPGDPQVRFNRAVARYEEGDRAAARRILEELVAEAPERWHAQLQLGHLALDRADWPEALARYGAALAVHPLSAEAWAGRGVALLRDGRAEAGRAAIARALALDPDVQNAEALRRLLARRTP
jgi:tetratricopeptide (TPR) repeat protein